MKQPEQTFEEAISALETIVKTLEDGNCPLAEMTRLYEEGMRLSALCGKRLDAYEAKVTKLSQGGEAK